MRDEPFYSPNAKPTPARQPRVGNFFFEFHVERTHRFCRVELRDQYFSNVTAPGLDVVIGLCCLSA